LIFSMEDTGGKKGGGQGGKESGRLEKLFHQCSDGKKRRLFGPRGGKMMAKVAERWAN